MKKYLLAVFVMMGLASSAFAVSDPCASYGGKYCVGFSTDGSFSADEAKAIHAREAINIADNEGNAAADFYELSLTDGISTSYTYDPAVAAKLGVSSITAALGQGASVLCHYQANANQIQHAEHHLFALHNNKGKVSCTQVS